MPSAPRRLFIRRIITLLLQELHRRTTNARNTHLRRGDLEVSDVRQLIVPTRGMHGLVGRKTLVEVVTQILQGGGVDKRAACGAGGHNESAGVQILGD
jgi:hypothetical protein